MSGRGPGTPTSGSQFFITLADAPVLEGRFNVFGEVVSGMDVLKQLTPRTPQEHGPPGDKMLEVTVTEGS
jgi:cyclophilin family peptidyl-prolyl cis-trans isomerase